MPNFIIEDVEIIVVGGFVHVKGRVEIPEIDGAEPLYSKYPFKVFIKAKRVGTNDFYFTKANIDSLEEKPIVAFDGAIDLPGEGRNYKIWIEVMSRQDRIGTKTDEKVITIHYVKK